MYAPIWNAVRTHLSADRMQSEIAEFFAFSRWSSFDKIVGLAQRIAERMEEAGLEDVRLIAFPADGRTAYGGWMMPMAYDVEEARLQLLRADQPAIVLADYHRNPTSLMLYSLPTPPEGITAELVVADTLEEMTARIALQFRIANQHRNEIIELEAQVVFSAMEPDDRGATVRRYTPLTLERNKVTFFPLSWTIVHPIDERSPFAGKAQDELERAEAEILILLSGIDETYEQTVHARSSYRVNEIVWNARFRSMFVPMNARAHVSVDVSTLHDIEPAP